MSLPLCFFSFFCQSNLSNESPLNNNGGNVYEWTTDGEHATKTEQVEGRLLKFPLIKKQGRKISVTLSCFDGSGRPKGAYLGHLGHLFPITCEGSEKVPTDKSLSSKHMYCKPFIFNAL